MKRPALRLVEPPISLAEMRCEQCGQGGAVVVAFGRDRRGEIMLTWCSIAHAQRDGWPWLSAEKRRRRAGGARSPPSAPTQLRCVTPGTGTTR